TISRPLLLKWTDLGSYMLQAVEHCITGEAACCRTTSTKCTGMSLWHMYLYGAPNRRMPHRTGNRGSIRPRDSNRKICLKTRVAINSRFRNTKHHRFDNNNNRFRSKTIHL
ncbi:hypothetical protein CR513_35472, partial [Mucuna pruriens]